MYNIAQKYHGKITWDMESQDYVDYKGQIHHIAWLNLHPVHAPPKYR
jgi:hypothetical protein